MFLARYLIEPDKYPTIEFLPERQKLAFNVRDELVKTLEIEYTFSKGEFKQNKKEALKKTKLVIEDIKDKLTNDPKAWEETLNTLDLKPIERDIILTIGFEKEQNIEHISVDVNA